MSREKEKEHARVRVALRLALPWVRCLDPHGCPDIRPASEAHNWPVVEGVGRVCPACLARLRGERALKTEVVSGNV